MIRRCLHPAPQPLGGPPVPTRPFVEISQDRQGNAGIGNGGSSESPSLAAGGNPAATDLQVGSGWLGDRLGLNKNGFRLGGISIFDVNAQPTGGINPGSWTTNSLSILDMSLDMEEWIDCEGGEFGVEFLYYTGGNVNGDAGTVMGYNSLDGEPPRSRFEIYTLWYRQMLFDKMLSIRVGKLVPVYDFNNVARSTPYSEDNYGVPAITSAIITPLYVNPTQLGVMPGYYNSATGLVASFCPNERAYAQYGLYDGSLAAGRQTGLEGPHFNGYAMQVFELGTVWQIGSQEKPGKIGAGYWKQTGLLEAPGGTVNGADGMYLFTSQRLYYERPFESSNGLFAWGQFAATDSDFIDTHRFVGSGIDLFRTPRWSRQRLGRFCIRLRPNEHQPGSRSRSAGDHLLLVLSVPGQPELLLAAQRDLHRDAGQSSGAQRRAGPHNAGDRDFLIALARLATRCSGYSVRTVLRCGSDCPSCAGRVSESRPHIRNSRTSS